MWERIGAAVMARRAQLRLTREELADLARVSSRVISDIERARRANFDPSTLLRLENALGWASGSLALIGEGRDPAPLIAQPPLPAVALDLAALLSPLSGLSEDDRTNLRRLIELVLVPYLEKEADLRQRGQG